MDTKQPFLSEFAYLLMFTKSMTKQELFNAMYGKSRQESKRTIFNHLIKKLDLKIDKKLTKEKQLEQNRSLIMNNYSYSIDMSDNEINALIVRIKKTNKAQIQEEILELKRKKYEYTRRLKEVKKEREVLKKGKIIMRGYPIYYRASSKNLLSYWNITNQEVIPFFNEFIRLPAIEYRLNQFNQELLEYYESRYTHKDSIYADYKQDHDVNACRILSVFLRELIRSVLNPIYSHQYKYYRTKEEEKKERIFKETGEYPMDLVSMKDFEVKIDLMEKWVKDYSFPTREFLLRWHKIRSETDKNIPDDEKSQNRLFGVLRLLWHFDVCASNAIYEPLNELIKVQSERPIDL